MYGRYGSDQLNMAILVAAVLVSLTNSVLTVFLRESTVYSGIVAPILSVIVYGLLIYSFFRMFSRNIYKRQRENRRFTQLWMRLKDRNNRYFRCPNCKQTVRVPRGFFHKNERQFSDKTPKIRRCGTQFRVFLA